MDRFHDLKYGLGLILILIGIKMASKEFLLKKFGWDPGPVWPLIAVLLLLGGSVALSLLIRPRKEPGPGTPP